MYQNEHYALLFSQNIETGPSVVPLSLSVAVGSIAFFWSVRLSVVDGQMQFLRYGVAYTFLWEMFVSLLLVANAVLGFLFTFRFRKWIESDRLAGRIVPESWGSSGFARIDVLKMSLVNAVLIGVFLYLCLKGILVEPDIWTASPIILFAFGSTSFQLAVYTVCFAPASVD